MTSPRVRHLLKGLGPGGAERLVVAQASAPGSYQHEVAYLLPNKNHLVPLLDEADIISICLDTPSVARLGWIRRLRRLLRDNPTDVLHIHSPAVAAISRLVVRTLPKASRPAMVGTEHNRWPRHHWLTRRANRLTIRFEAATIAVSDDVASTIVGASENQVRVIEHGIDTAAVRAEADRVEVRNELGVSDDDVVVICVANLRREKSLDVLVAATALAVRDAPNLRVIQVGQGPLAGELDDLVIAAGVDDNFFTFGYRADVPRLMSGADAFALSSTHEGLPVAIMEALSLGLPIIATDAGGVAGAAGSAGRISAVGDAEALAANLSAIANDAALRNQLSVAAVVEARRFEISRAIEEVNAVYAEAMAGTG